MKASLKCITNTIVSLFLACSLAACGSSGVELDEKVSDSDADVITETSGPKYVEDLEGYTLRIFDVGSADDRYYSMFDNDDFKEVVETVSELYNCSIVEVTSDDYYKDITNGVMLGESFCDIAILPAHVALNLITNEYAIPWQTVQSVDLSAEWWDKSANKRYNLGGVQLALSGDFNINNAASQICYLYNREKLDADYCYDAEQKYVYSSMLIDDAAHDGWFDTDRGFSPSWVSGESYLYNGGICGSTYDYYRTMLAGQGVDFYNISEDGRLSLSYGTGTDYIGKIEGMTDDPDRSRFISMLNSDLVDMKELALSKLKLDLMGESLGPVDMSDFKACDKTLFTNGTSTFKIARLDEVPALIDAGMDIGIVTLPGTGYTSLVDTPTLAVQPLLTGDEYKNLVILDALAKYSSKKMLPDFLKSFIGEKPENNDPESTYSYNEKMLDKISEKPCYEFDIGTKGEALHYLYYKYMLRYNVSDRWRISNDKFESSVSQMMYLDNISDSLESIVEKYSVTEPVTSDQ